MTGEKPTADQVLDHVAIDALRELQRPGEPDVLGTLVNLFEEDSAARLHCLQRGVEHNNPDDVRRAAHGLGGGSAVFGAMALRAVCVQLEAAARAGELQHAPGLVGRLLVEYERLRWALHEEVARASRR